MRQSEQKMLKPYLSVSDETISSWRGREETKDH